MSDENTGVPFNIGQALTLIAEFQESIITNLEQQEKLNANVSVVIKELGEHIINQNKRISVLEAATVKQENTVHYGTKGKTGLH